MKQSFIYISNDGIPMAPTVEVPEKFAAAAHLLKKVKASCIPFREEDRHYVLHLFPSVKIDNDTFIKTNEPYEFEVEEWKSHLGTITVRHARIMRHSEPKADPKEKELEQLIDLLREAFNAGMDKAAAFEWGSHSADFKQWVQDNDKEIKQCLNR